MKQLPNNFSSPGISKKWSAFFCAFNISGDTKNFVHISGNIESTKKADHIFEMPGLMGILWLLSL